MLKPDYVSKSRNRSQNRAFIYSDEKLEEDDEIKESDNPLYSSRFDYDWGRLV